MTIEFADDNPSAVDVARAALSAILGTVVTVAADEHKELPALPVEARQYGEAVEVVKRGVATLTETRTLLADRLADLKGAHTDVALGGKESLTDAGRSRLRSALTADDDYQRALALDAELRTLLGRWDARRSRLNRDGEVAIANHRANRVMDAAEVSSRYIVGAIQQLEKSAPEAADAIADALAHRLRGSADYFVTKLRSAL